MWTTGYGGEGRGIEESGWDNCPQSPFCLCIWGKWEEGCSQEPNHITALGLGEPPDIPGPQCGSYSEVTAKVFFVVLRCCWLLLQGWGNPKVHWLTQATRVSSPRYLLSKLSLESCAVCSVLHGTRCPPQASVNCLSCPSSSSGHAVYCTGFNNWGDPVLPYVLHGQTKSL